MFGILGIRICFFFLGSGLCCRNSTFIACICIVMQTRKSYKVKKIVSCTQTIFLTTFLLRTGRKHFITLLKKNVFIVNFFSRIFVCVYNIFLECPVRIESFHRECVYGAYYIHRRRNGARIPI